MHKIYIGYDSREIDAYNACVNSLLSHSTSPLEIIPLKIDDLRNKGVYWRDLDVLSSTEFTFTRFLIPFLENYKGVALFCDCDFIFLEDVSNLFNLQDPTKAVQCCKHQYTPSAKTKMDGATQHLYPRKNWSSLVIYNCEHPANKKLTSEVVNSETGQYLHRFMWLSDEDIGDIPIQWNWLTDWYNEPEDGHPKALHFTQGGPWHIAYSNCKYNEVWLQYGTKTNI